MKAKERVRIKKHFRKKTKKAIARGNGNKFLSSNASRMKREPTEAEKVFKQILKEKGVPFKDQVPFILEGHYFIFDFVVCGKWVVEIDGGYHNTEEQREKDRNRDEYLAGVGYKIKRFTNADVLYYSDNLRNWLSGIYGGFHIKEYKKKKL